MLKDIGALMGLMKNMGKIKEEMQNLQMRLGQISAEGESGGGMVKFKINGQMEVQSCKIIDEAMKDRELLEDLIASACNQALKKVREAVAEETQKMAGSLGLPSGMNLPGLS